MYANLTISVVDFKLDELVFEWYIFFVLQKRWLAKLKELKEESLGDTNKEVAAIQRTYLVANCSMMEKTTIK